MNAGWERVITQEGGFISLYPVNNRLPSYRQWQSICDSCLPQAPPPPTATPSPSPVPPTPTPTSVGTVTSTPTAMASPTATIVGTSTATIEATPLATVEGTPDAETSPTPEQPSYSARITGITLQDGRYIVDFVTNGFTPVVPGQHVHFFFDTVSTANAGVPGSGPWKLYGGPSPFTEYSESDKYFDPTSMCILVANEDHSIIPGTGNCYPLP